MQMQESESVMQVLSGHEGPVRSLQFDSTKVVSGGIDHSVRLFDIASPVGLF